MATALALFASVPLAPVAWAQDKHTFAGPLPDTGGIDPKLDPRVVSITTGFACNCGTCPNLPVGGSGACTCANADRMRANVASFISQGMDRGAIIAKMVELHGETILPKPPFAGLGLVAWLAPFVAITVVGGWLFVTLRRWSAKSQASMPAARPRPEEGGAPRAPVPEDSYLAQVDAELERREGEL